MTARVLIPIGALCGFLNVLSAQCSDAGVCSLGQRSEPSAHSVSLSYGFGKSGKTDSLTFHAIEAAASIEIIPGGRLLIAVPFNNQSGPLGSVSGIGDLTVAWHQTLSSSEPWAVGFQVGGKIALAHVNAENLPQAYQSGLGTNDLLLGVLVQYSEWNAALAYQYSPGRSDNRLTRLKRGDDLLVRAGYTSMVDGFRLAGEILAIKRLHRSSIVTSTLGQLETFGDVPDSDQAQVNLVGRGAYPLSETVEIGFMAAIPLLKREVNVDGLTRSIALSAGLTVSL
ncbi:MAG TPA: hypothetical protein VGA55_05755 [Bacteroidota bacterium]